MATVNLGKIKLKWKGGWNSSDTFTADDVVSYTDGSVTSSYIAVATSTNQVPSTGGSPNSSYWEYLAKGQATSPTTTQGDLIVRGASADERLAIGAAGKSLVVNSSANGLEYGDGGKVVGFALSPSFTTEQYVQQSSYQLVGSALTYTATSASNKLLILHNHSMLVEDPQTWYMALYRDGLSGTQLYERRSYSQDAQWIPTQGVNSVVVDIPDTSSHTYQFAMYRTGSTNRTIYNYHGGATSGGVVQIIAMELVP